MKLSNLKGSLAVGAALCGMLSLSSCRPGGKIPVDENKAAEHIISGAQVVSDIKSFRAGEAELGRINGTDSFLNKEFKLPYAESFNRDAIAALLNADGAVGIRIYLGRDDANQIRLVLLPVDKFGNDIHTKLVSVPLPAGNQPRVLEAQSKTESYQGVDIGQRCPTDCDTSTNGTLN